MAKACLARPPRGASLAWVATALVAGCTGPSDPPQDLDAPGVRAIVDPARAHWLDAPFPSDDLADEDGRVDLIGVFPEVSAPLGGVIAAWVRALSTDVRGFGANSPVWFRFEDAIAVPESTEGLATDPVLLINLRTGERYPLTLRFTASPADDPLLAANTLALAPALGHTPPSGATLAAIVMRSAGVSAPDGYMLPEGVAEALALAEVSAAPAVATVYTVQDTQGELTAWHDGQREALQGWSWQAEPLRRATELSYEPGTTPTNGRATQIARLRFEDGDDALAYLTASSASRTIDLTELPMVVYGTTVQIPYWQGLQDQPFMRPGVGHLADVSNTTGRVDAFQLPAPEPDPLRVLIALPKGDDGEPEPVTRVMLWDHGTSGSAANCLQRRNPGDENLPLLQALADSGTALVCRDLPLYGARFPLVDRGFDDGSLGFYNVVNLPAFRDNQRVAGLEGEALRHFVTTALPDLFEPGLFDPRSIARFGHSLGTTTALNGVGADPSAWDAVFLSGPNGSFVLSVLETGLGGGSGLSETLLDLFGVEPEPGDDLGVAIAAGLGITDRDARRRLDRLHPVLGLFSWIVDPSDATTFADALTPPITMLMGVGDRQIPNRGTEALAARLPSATLVRCEVSGDFDPHYCLYREPLGRSTFEDWLASW